MTAPLSEQLLYLAEHSIDHDKVLQAAVQDTVVVMSPADQDISFNGTSLTLPAGHLLCCSGQDHLQLGDTCLSLSLGGSFTKHLQADDARIVAHDFRPLLGPIAWQINRADNQYERTSLAWQVADLVLDFCTVTNFQEKIVLTIATAIRRNDKPGLSLKWHADRAGVSPSTISRWFKEFYGISPKAYRRMILRNLT